MDEAKEDRSADIEQASATLLADLRARSQSDREVFVSLQSELRRVARSKLRFERPDHTLRSGALVNELFMKVFSSKQRMDFSKDRSTLLRLLSYAMGQVLNDHADKHNAQIRGGAARKRVPLDENQAKELFDGRSWVELDSDLLVRPEQSEEILGVREALKILRRASVRQALVLELQYYAGLTQEEIASALGVSVETIKLDTRKAKAFLKVHLTEVQKSN